MLVSFPLLRFQRSHTNPESVQDPTPTDLAKVAANRRSRGGAREESSSGRMSAHVGRLWRLVSQDQRQVYTTADNRCDDRAAYAYHTLDARDCVLMIEYGGTGPGCHPE